MAAGVASYIEDHFLKFDEVVGHKILEGTASQELNNELHKLGFIHQYAQSAIHEDFASLAEHLFLEGQIDFWRRIKEHQRLRKKLEIVIEFYQQIHRPV